MKAASIVAVALMAVGVGWWLGGLVRRGGMVGATLAPEIGGGAAEADIEQAAAARQTAPVLH